MTPPTAEDLPRITAVTHVAMDLWEAHGMLAMKLADEWADGAGTANLDPDAHGNRWELDDDGNVWAIPADPTGEASLRARSALRSEIDGLLRLQEATAVRLRNIVMTLVPVKLDAGENDPRWCTNHLRIGVCEPRARGDLCRWCDDKRLEWGVRPPVRLMTMRHLGKTVYDRDVKDALAAEGVRLETVQGVTKAVSVARGRTGRANQNSKRKAG